MRIERYFEFCFLQMNIYSTWLISIGLPPTPIEPACAKTVIWEMIFIDILAVIQVRILVMWFNLAWTFPDFKKCSISLESNKWLSFWGTLGSQGYFKTVVGFLISFQTEKTAGVVWNLVKIFISDFRWKLTMLQWFPSGDSGKELTCQCIRDVDSIHGSERSSGEVHGNPLQYSCLENAMDRGTWLCPAIIQNSVADSGSYWKFFYV